jgi:3-oxoacyl-[acyl-carrier-protein] synthase III
MLPINIIGSGVYAPGEPIDNMELKSLAGIEFDHEKISQKLGIRKRHIACLRKIPETTADFAVYAANNALKDAGIEASQVGLFVVGSDTPEFITPATAILQQGRLQGKEGWASAFDVCASCASFTIALDQAVRIMATDESIQYALVTGVYNMPAYIRPGDAFAWPIFADGAGSVVLKRTTGEETGYITGQMLSDGTQWDYIGVYAGGTRKPVTKEVLDNNEYGLLNLQPLPGDRNLRLWPMILEKLLKKGNLDIEQVDHFIFTQINKSVILKVMDLLGQPEKKTSFVMDQYGYTGSACVPMAYHHARCEGKVRRGDVVAFVASGAGLAVGSNLFIQG